jgi:hypothetical protein
MTSGLSVAELHERVRELEREKLALETALRRERERSIAEARRAAAYEETRSIPWRVAAAERNPLRYTHSESSDRSVSAAVPWG